LPTNSGKAKEPTKGNAANLIFHAAHSAGCKPKTVFMLLLLLGAFDALALLLDCSYMALVRGGPETEAQPLSNTKHQTPKQQNRKPCSIRGPN